MFYVRTQARGRYYQGSAMNVSSAGKHAAAAIANISTVNSKLPDVVSLMIGTNDIGGPTPASIWASIKTCIIGYLNGSATYVVVWPILPRVNTVTWSWDGLRETDRLALNALIADFANPSTNPDLVKYVNNIKLGPNMDALMDMTQDVDSVDGLHPNWNGAAKVGNAGYAVFNSLISASDLLGLYTDSSNLLIQTSRNPQLTGTTGSKPGSGGVVATGWEQVGIASMTVNGSKTTLNGATAQRVVISGSSTGAGQSVRFDQQLVGTTLPAGTAWEAWVDFVLAPGATNIRGILATLTGFSNSSDSGRSVNMDSNGLTGVLRTHPALITTDQVNPFMMFNVINNATGAVAADITWGRPMIRQVSQL
jgi:lysophospholipase L1-like esterase